MIGDAGDLLRSDPLGHQWRTVRLVTEHFLQIIGIDPLTEAEWENLFNHWEGRP